MASVSKRKCDQNNKQAKYLISWYDAEVDRWRTTTGYTDKALSLAQGQRLEIESAKRREGFTSNVRDESLKPIEEPLAEYLTHIRTRNPDENYLAQLEQRIRRILTEIKARRILDITLGKVESVLLGLKSIRGFQEGGKLLSITTRNEYATSITGFTRWAKARRKLEYDPLEGLTKPEVGDDDRAHPGGRSRWMKCPRF